MNARRHTGSLALLAVALTALATAGLLLATSAPAQDAPRRLEGFRLEPAWVSGAARPPSHDSPDWLRAHGMESASASCMSCHSESSCEACHATPSGGRAVHPAGYVMLHGREAMADEMSCASCHNPAWFCRECHMSANIVPDGRHRPLPFAAAHPDGWLTPGSATNHAHAARADLLSCASCHGGDSCVACHIDTNPHGRDFQARCETLLSNAAPTCAQCHTASSPLPLEVLRGHPGCR